MSRPEHQAPPEVFYGIEESCKYSSCSRILKIQGDITRRTIELLNLPEDCSCCLLDIGCGSGLSGEVISEGGHWWVGVDISSSMLDVALEREVEGDMCLNDIGQGLPFRSGTFDGVLSVSAIQWLCNADTSTADPYKRMLTFFKDLYSVLKKGGRAALQFYPENAKQAEMLTSAATRCGFGGGLVVDFPNSTRAKKYYLCLYAGIASHVHNKKITNLHDMSQEHIKLVKEKKRKRDGSVLASSRPHGREWVMNKKARQRNSGKSVKADSKYTGRRRATAF